MGIIGLLLDPVPGFLEVFYGVVLILYKRKLAFSFHIGHSQIDQ
jgi:hypothetical protein